MRRAASIASAFSKHGTRPRVPAAEMSGSSSEEGTDSKNGRATRGTRASANACPTAIALAHSPLFCLLSGSMGDSTRVLGVTTATRSEPA